jgi:4-amino-4-deoxy-L-arabinose transferase-like glycosyltransferase
VSPRPRSNAARPQSGTPRRAPQPSAPATTPRWTERVRTWHVAAALALVHLVLALLWLDPTVHSGGDNAAYLALARSLLERGTYQELWEPAMRPHTQYPPGWPLLLAGAMTVGVKPWVGFKVFAILFSAAAVALSYLWARRVSTTGVALAVGTLMAVSPGVLDLARWELSDVPFWCFTMLALWAFARAADVAPAGAEPVPGGERKALQALAFASVAVLMAYATRSAAVPMVAAAAAWLVWRRRWRGLALFGAIVGAYAVPWWARGRALGGANYASQLWYVDPYQPALGTVGVAGMFARIWQNVVEYTTDHLPYLLIGDRRTMVALVVGAAVLLLAAVGWALRLRRAGVAELWLPLYLGLVLIWPSEWSGERFLLPVLPMLLVCAGEVVRMAGRRIGQPVPLGAGLAAAVFLMGVSRTSHELRYAASCRAAYGPESRYPCLPQNWLDFLDLAGASRGQLPPNSAVLARKPTLFWAQSGYRSRPYPFTADPDSMIAAAREAGAEYVMLDYLDNVSTLYLGPVLMQRPQAFCVVTTAGSGRATLMKLLPGAEAMRNVRDRPGNETADVGFSRCEPSLPVMAEPPPPAR